jgi:hypothetical protein
LWKEAEKTIFSIGSGMNNWGFLHGGPGGGMQYIYDHF